MQYKADTIEIRNEITELMKFFKIHLNENLEESTIIVVVCCKTFRWHSI